MTKHSFLPKPIYILFFILVLISLFAYGIYVSTPNNVFGNDFFDFYTASQAAYIDGISPYSEEVELRNQLGLYGRPAEPGENLMAFNYPPYALFFFYPLAYLPIKWAQSFWFSFLLTVLLFSPILAFQKIPRWALFTYFFLYPISFGLVLGNFAILVFACLIFVISYLMYSKLTNQHSDVLCGILIALATIKPQFSLIFLLFILLFVFKHKKWLIFKTTMMSVGLLLALSFVFLPSWPMEWLNQIKRHAYFNDSIPHLTIFLQTFINDQLSSIISILLFIVLFLLLSWILYRWWQGKFNSFLILVFIGFLTYLIHPRSVSYEQMVFLLPFLIWIFSNPPSVSTITKLSFWFSAILISWAGFFASKAGWASLFPLEWIFLFYLIWMGYIFLSPNAVHLQTYDSTDPQTLVESN